MTGRRIDRRAFLYGAAGLCTAVAADCVAAQVLAECYEPFTAEAVADTLAHAARLELGIAGRDGIAIKEAVA